MSDKIFLVQGDKLVAMERSRYSLEDHLQDLLARYPDLMPGEQLNSAEPRRWMLVSREIGVPDSEGAADRWSLDHLFLDQDGVPTLVEAKRSTDPRIRREVVGQLIEYAANAQSYWNVQQIRDLFAQRNPNETEALSTSLGVTDIEEFWQKVKSNLQAGRLRLIFVADAIPQELKRMIEFLNVQMDPAEVFGIELPQFLGGEMQTIVPRLIGNTAQAAERKATSASPKIQWDEESFFVDLQEHQSLEEYTVVREFLDRCRSLGMLIWWGTGSREASFIAYLDFDGTSYYLLRMTSRGWFSVLCDYFRDRSAFRGTDPTRRVIESLNQAASLKISENAKRPNIKTSSLFDQKLRDSFFETISSLITEIRDFHKKSMSEPDEPSPKLPS